MKLQMVAIGVVGLGLTMNASSVKAQNTNMATSSTRSVSDEPEYVTLRLNVAPGTRYRMTQTTAMKNTIITAAMGKRAAEKVEMNILVTNAMDYAVLYNNLDGTMQVRVTYRDATARIAAMQNGKKVSMPAGSDSTNYLSGQSVEMKVSPEGNISDVRGLDKIWDKAFTGSSSAMPPQMQREMRNTMKKTFGDNFLKSLSQQSGVSFPQNPVRIGGSWSQRLETTGMLPFVINVRRTLQSRDNGALIIGESGTIAVGDAKKPLAFGGANVKMLISGTYSGTTMLDETTNFVSAAHTTQKFGGTISSNVRNQKVSARLYGTAKTKLVTTLLP